jgi:hypothetical protein
MKNFLPILFPITAGDDVKFSVLASMAAAPDLAGGSLRRCPAGGSRRSIPIAVFSVVGFWLL